MECKNNPKLRLWRRLGLFLHRFGFFNPPFLKSLDYHNLDLLVHFFCDRRSEKIIAFDKKELQVGRSWKTETYFLSFFRLCQGTYLVSKYFNYFSYNTTFITQFVRRIFMEKTVKKWLLWKGELQFSFNFQSVGVDFSAYFFACFFLLSQYRRQGWRKV